MECARAGLHTTINSLPSSLALDISSEVCLILNVVVFFICHISLHIKHGLFNLHLLSEINFPLYTNCLFCSIMSLSIYLFQMMDESMTDDPERFHSNKNEFDNVLSDIEMLIDRELGNT